MPFSIQVVEDADVHQVAEVLYRSQIPDGIQQWIAATWPGLDTTEGRAEAATRFGRIRSHLPDPSQFLKVVDDQDGSLVAFSVCFYNAEPPKTPSGLTETIWATAEDREYALSLKEEREALLIRTMSRFNGPVTEILAFFVDASRQHQGIGTLLMQHLVNLSQQRQAPVVLLANRTAVAFYKKQGFQIVEDRKLLVPEKWDARPPAYLVSMVYRG